MANLMNIHTGSVDTTENWAAEGYTIENSGLVEVEKDEYGCWVALWSRDSILLNLEIGVSCQ